MVLWGPRFNVLKWIKGTVEESRLWIRIRIQNPIQNPNSESRFRIRIQNLNLEPGLWIQNPNSESGIQILNPNVESESGFRIWNQNKFESKVQNPDFESESRIQIQNPRSEFRIQMDNQNLDSDSESEYRVLWILSFIDFDFMDFDFYGFWFLWIVIGDRTLVINFIHTFLVTYNFWSL